ncbi:MAG: cyclopropane-fatty-acyl-phospholipid synthase family protein [Acidobacteriota bacterium]|nr:cyclopropane-fatty-acyl-phospholipid synthase family protein [Blastocatellia bacterium]MDW8238423.1 cyclopropane-fatty-acyl-phospholipid synthase family protein [Acidobacteriota bacterium]
MWYEKLLERNLLPDWMIRIGIRQIVASRLRQERQSDARAQQRRLEQFVEELKQSPIALNTRDANAQHYDVPAAFFKLVLGRRLKYSCCYWPVGVATLDEAEEAMLALTCQRARVADGQQVLDLGCGWGSLSLYLAELYPNSRIIGVSNSRAQKAFIDAEAARRGLTNLQIITSDMNSFSTSLQFDRIISIEMFEHMRNYQTLLARIASWMKPDGLLFVHIFCHQKYAYPYEDRGPNDWMARHFFTGGIMPSHDLLLHFQNDVRALDRWRISGVHYQRTCQAWLNKMDQHRSKILAIFADVYGRSQAVKRWVYWRVFFMACAELFGYRQGQEWGVSHYLFEKRDC